MQLSFDLFETGGKEDGKGKNASLEVQIHRELHWGIDCCDKINLSVCFLRWVEKVIQQEPKDPIAKMNKIADMLHRLPIESLNTKANLITKTKNLLKRLEGENSPLYLVVKKSLHLGKAEKNRRDRQLEMARFQKASACLEFDEEKIRLIIKKYSHSDEWQRRAIALALATGLRQQEILTTAKIVKTNSTHIWLQGLLKKRDNKEEYSRPTLFMTPTEVAVLLQEIQTISVKDINPYTASSALVKEVKKTFGKEWTFHRLRAAYCNLSFKELATSESLPCWIHKVLNHSSNTMVNALFYCNVKASGKH